MFRNWLKGSRDMHLAVVGGRRGKRSASRRWATGTWPLKACPMDGGGTDGIGPHGDDRVPARRVDLRGPAGRAGGRDRTRQERGAGGQHRAVADAGRPGGADERSQAGGGGSAGYLSSGGGTRRSRRWRRGNPTGRSWLRIDCLNLHAGLERPLGGERDAVNPPESPPPVSGRHWRRRVSPRATGQFRR